MGRVRALGFACALVAFGCKADEGGNGTPGGSSGKGGVVGGGLSGAGAGHAGGATAGTNANSTAGRGGGGANALPGSGGANTSAGRGGANSAGRGGGAAGMSGPGPGNPGTSTGTLLERLSTTDNVVPVGVKPGVRNFRIWASTMLKIAPVFTVPLADCGTLVGFSSGAAASPNARVARLDASDKLVETLDIGAGLELRGLAAEPDGHFGALLWSPAMKQIWLKRFDLKGVEAFSTELTNLMTGGLGPNKPTDFGIGESRVEFGAGKYGAYYHVHSDSGHEGDTLKFVTAADGKETTQWPWGCSHSMSNLLTFSPTANTFLPSCVTDCFPGTSSSSTDYSTTSKGGIYTDNRNKVMDVAAGCNGNVAGELGGAAVAPMGWKIVFNAHQAPTVLGQKSYDTAAMNQDIGFASIGANHVPMGAVVWLTTTPANEADSALARWQPAGDSAEQYVVGWLEPPSKYNLGRIDGAGAVLEAPADVSSKAKWGMRDDPFRVHTNGDIVWSWFDAANGTTLHFARLRSGGTAQCTAL